MAKFRKILALTLMLALVTSTTVAYASNPAILLPDGEELSTEEMEQTRGELGSIVLGALGGAIVEGVSYAISHAEDFSWRDFGTEIARGAAEGAALATFGIAGAIYKGAKELKTAVTAADVAWDVWGSANVGALKGALETAKRESENR